MDGCWFHKFKSNKDKMQSSKNKESASVVKERSKPLTNDEAPSNVTQQKVAAAKQYIENHYKKQMKNLQERKERANNIYKRRAERDLLAEVDSNYIVKLYCSFQDEDCLYLIMEYLPGGDMMTLLMRKDILTENEARFYVGETVLAIESIHKHNYIHRDIKPDNLLLDRHGHMKLSDFGICKPLDCSNLQEKDFSTGNNRSGALQSNGQPVAPKRIQQEQLLHWQRNRRMLDKLVLHDWVLARLCKTGNQNCDRHLEALAS